MLAALAWTVLAGSARAAGGESAQQTQLGSAIGGVEGQIGGLQATLDRRGAQLAAVHIRLAAERARLDQLERTEGHAEKVLATQLVDNYEASPPDVVNVVIEATSVGDLLDRIRLAHVVQQEDARVVASVRAARRAVSSEAIRLGVIDAREQRIAAEVGGQQNALDRAQLAAVQQELSAIQLHSAKEIRLARKRGTVASLEQQLAQLEAAGVAESPGGSSTGPPSAKRRHARSFTFPLPRSDTSPPSTWDSGQGVDLSAPGDTPEYAVCSGTIVLRGMGGFGPWAPVLHCDRPLDGNSYIYYGYAGPQHQLPVGTHVNSGRVMSSVGPGIVGISSGPQLELGFCDASGNPIGPQTASTMLSLLQAAY